MRALFARLLLAAVVLVAFPAAAADAVPPADSAAEARSQYQQGTQAFAQKRYPEAAAHFEAAAAYRVNAVTLYTAGLAWDLASRPERAADAFARALDLPGLDAKQTQTARDRLTQIEKSLGTLVVSGPDGVTVRIDQATETQVPVRLHASPGVHTLSVRIPGKPIERRDVTLDIGKTINLEIKEEPKVPPVVEVAPPSKPAAEAPPPAPPPAPPLPAPLPFWTLRRVVGVGIGGVGVAAGIATAILGVNATGAESAYNASPSREALDHAGSLETWTNVMLVSSVLLVAAGVVLVALPEKDVTVKVRGGPGSIALGGSF